MDLAHTCAGRLFPFRATSPKGGRASTGEFKQFLGHARGSLLEVETQILIAQNLEYIQTEHGEHLLQASAEIGRILNGLMTSLQQNR